MGTDTDWRFLVILPFNSMNVAIVEWMKIKNAVNNNSHSQSDSKHL